MPTLNWLNSDAAFRTAAGVPTRVLRPHAAGGHFGDGTHMLFKLERGMSVGQQIDEALG